MSERPVHVVVVAYEAPEALDDALAPLAGRLPVTVVDNSQSDAVRGVCTGRGVDYLATPRNLGFGAGANVALREIAGGAPQDVLLLNPDATIAAADVDVLARALRAEATIAAVAPRLVDDGAAPVRVLWPFPSPGKAWLEALGLGRLTGRDPAFAIGAVLLLRWEALREVGLFDERFFLYAEEADWQQRALRAGWRTAYCPDVAAYHRGAGTSTDPTRREVLFHAAQETYVRKWSGTRGWQAYRAAAVVGAATRLLLLRGSRRAYAARRLRLYLRGPRRAAAGLA